MLTRVKGCPKSSKCVNGFGIGNADLLWSIALFDITSEADDIDVLHYGKGKD